MKRNFLKKLLAAALASLLLFGIPMSASASWLEDLVLKNMFKDHKSTIQITQLPAQIAQVEVENKNKKYSYWEQELISENLYGLEFTLLDSAFPDGSVRVKYDEVMSAEHRNKIQDGKYIWEFSLMPVGGTWNTKDKTALLNIRVYKQGDFEAEALRDGVEYGSYFTRYIASDFVEIPVQVVDVGKTTPALSFDQTQTLPLVLDRFTRITAETKGYSIFSFTAPEDGFYRFDSLGGTYGESLHTKEGTRAYFERVSPQATLYREDGTRLVAGDGSYWNFKLNAKLGANQTVYIKTWDAEGFTTGYDLRVRQYRVNTTQEVKPAKVSYHSYVSPWVFATEENFERIQNAAMLSYSTTKAGKPILKYSLGLHYAENLGKATVYLLLDDMTYIESTVTVRYDWKQWLKVIFLFGWIWMPYEQNRNYYY